MLSFKDTMSEEHEVENLTLTDSFSILKNAEINSHALSARCRYLQLFRERLSEKVHATIPKGIVGGF